MDTGDYTAMYMLHHWDKRPRAVSYRSYREILEIIIMFKNETSRKVDMGTRI